MAAMVGGGGATPGSTSKCPGTSGEEVNYASSIVQEHWVVPGEWLEIYTTNSAAKRIEQSSEVLQKLEEVKKREAAKSAPQPWIKSQQADIIFAVVIILYGLLTGIDVEITVSAYPGQVSKQYETGMLIAQTVFVVIFLLELVLRVRAEGIQYCLPIVCSYRPLAPGGPRSLKFERCNPAGFLDTAIILFGTAEVGVSLVGAEGVSLAAAGPMRMLRLLRLVRIMKGLLVFEQLKLLCAGMLSSLSAVFWAFVLLAVLMYLGSLFCVILLGKNLALSQYFSGVGQALFTHFMIVTLEAWPDISDDVMDASSPLWGLYFIVFICISSLALMNLVTGVVCEKLLEFSRSDSDEEQPNQLAAYREDRDRFSEKMGEIFKACDLDVSQTIDSREFALMRERSDMRRLFKMMEVSDDLDSHTLFQILDVRAEGGLASAELVEALLRLRGSRRKIHSLMLQRDILHRHRTEAKRVVELEENLRQRTKAELSAVEDAVSAKLASLQRSMAAAPRVCKAAAVLESEGPAQKLAEGAPVVAGQWLQAEALPAKQLEGMEEATLKLLKAEMPEVYSNLPEGALEPAKTPSSVVAQGARAPHLVTGEPLRQQPWMKEAGTRLEALIGELDALHSWAKDLVDPQPDSLASSPGAAAVMAKAGCSGR